MNTNLNNCASIVIAASEGMVYKYAKSTYRASRILGVNYNGSPIDVRCDHLSGVSASYYGFDANTMVEIYNDGNDVYFKIKANTALTFICIGYKMVSSTLPSGATRITINQATV